MIAGPTVSGWTMRRALGYTMAALQAAGEVDVDRTAEDRVFFGQERAKLEPLAGPLAAAEQAVGAFDLGPGVTLQARVELGDAVLDRGVRTGNARTKIGVKGQPGLGAAHVFGHRVDELTGEKLRLEPLRVQEAAGRLDDLPDFEGRAAIKQDLIARADKQEGLLTERDHGHSQRDKLKSELVRRVAEDADALARTKAALDARFPRQRSYVASFFLDVTSRRSAPRAEPEPAPPAPGPIP